MRADIKKCGDKDQWSASFNGFYLPWGYHSNNSSATLRDVESNHIAWFTHHTKHGKVPIGREHHLLQREICLTNCWEMFGVQIIMDHDTSANAIVTT